MNFLGYALWAAAAGALIPVMAILNGTLARATGQPAVAATILFAVGFSACLLFSLLSGARGLGAIDTAPPRAFAGGLIVAFYVVSVTLLAPRFGIGNTILFVMVAQIVTSAAIDHFALFGAAQREVTSMRIVGLVVMVSGLAIAQLGSR